ncbi:MAG: hypothetical protein ACOC1P_03585 [Minisyncoccales bacterium]
MAEIFADFAYSLTEVYSSFISSLPPWGKVFVNLFLLVVLVVVYSVFVWKLYRFISKRNPLGLNLNQYNQIEHSILSRLLRGGFYFIEYILILPFLIFIVFSIFTFLLILMSNTESVTHIFVISATVIASIRVTSYYSENLSQEIAKFLPFTLLTISVLNPYSFVQAHYIERILSQLSQLSSFFGAIQYYLLFIIFLEVILLGFDFVFSLFDLEEEDIKEKIEQEENKREINEQE